MKVIVSVIFWIASASIIDAQFFQGPFKQCLNPNNNPGFCMPMNECESISSIAYGQAISQTDYDFMRASECFGGYARVTHVCCTFDTGFHREAKSVVTASATGSPYWESPRRFFPPNEFERSERVRWPRFGDPEPVQQRRQKPKSRSGNDASRLPKPPTCGGLVIENKIYGGSEAGLREFPWMVLLEYQSRTPKDGKRIAANCGGSLINQRYVITAAHCVTGRIERDIGPLVAIRLGEHDTSSKIDCDSYGSCLPESTLVGFDEIISHELYEDKSQNKQFDIALIRLDRYIRFSDSLSPICLPSALKGRLHGGYHKPGTELTVAGWGQTLQDKESPVKRKLIVPVIGHKQCQRMFRQKRVNIVESQMCAGGKFAEDSCRGDSGGPLMHFREGVWVLEGIVSFGYHCGLLHWPGVHTRVASYEDWVRSKLRP